MIDNELDQRIRYTLERVAATVADPAPAPRPRRKLLTIGALALTGVALSAAAVVLGPEYVDRLPTDKAVISGSVGGDRYWVVPSFHKDACGDRMPGVEMIVESLNKVGDEWNTMGLSYGDLHGPCGVDESAWLGDPRRAAFAGFHDLTVAALHPSIVAVRVTVPGRAPVVIRTVAVPDQPGGARYAAWPGMVTDPETSVVLVTAAGTEISPTT